MLRTQSHSLKRASLEEVLKKLPWLTSEDQLQEAGRANRCAPANGSCADNEGLTTIQVCNCLMNPVRCTSLCEHLHALALILTLLRSST